MSPRLPRDGTLTLNARERHDLMQALYSWGGAVTGDPEHRTRMRNLERRVRRVACSGEDLVAAEGDRKVKASLARLRGGASAASGQGPALGMDPGAGDDMSSIAVRLMPDGGEDPLRASQITISTCSCGHVWARLHDGAGAVFAEVVMDFRRAAQVAQEIGGALDRIIATAQAERGAGRGH